MELDYTTLWSRAEALREGYGLQSPRCGGRCNASPPQVGARGDHEAALGARGDREAALGARSDREDALGARNDREDALGARGDREAT